MNASSDVLIAVLLYIRVSLGIALSVTSPKTRQLSKLRDDQCFVQSNGLQQVQVSYVELPEFQQDLYYDNMVCNWGKNK